MTFETKQGREYGQKADAFDSLTPEAARLASDIHRTMTDAKSAVDGMKATTEDHAARLHDVEQKMARRGQVGGAPEVESWGSRLIGSDAFKGLVSGGLRGTARVEVKAVTSVAGSGRALAPRDFRPDPVMLPQRQMTIRQLLAPGNTDTNLVTYARQTVRNLNAAMVAEGALKPESDIGFAEAEAPVRTLAHWIPISRQIFDDAPALASIVDGELRYGLDLVEENQLLSGDGTGQNLLGIIPQATAYDTTQTTAGMNKIDVILRAIGQSEAALLPATGIVLNTLDWIDILGLKDAGGLWLIGNPQGATQPTLWNRPVVVTPAIPRNRFLVGAFATGAQIFDRLDSEVLVSSEDRDNFVKNMLTARAEKRLAFAVKRPQAFITGTFPN